MSRAVDAREKGAAAAGRGGPFAVGLLAYSTFPVFAALLEPLFFRERLDALGVLWAAIALAGVAVLIPHWERGGRWVQGTL